MNWKIVRRVQTALAFATLALAACGRQAQPVQELEPATLRFGVPFERSHGDPLLVAAVERFQEENPQVIVELITQIAVPYYHEVDAWVEARQLDLLLWGPDPTLVTGEQPVVLGLVPFISQAEGFNEAAIPSYEGTVTVDWSSSMIGVLSTTEHPQEAVEVAYAVATSPELLAAWGDVPALKSLQADFIGELEAKYPGVDLQVAVDGLEYLGSTPHTAFMPNHAVAYARFDDLRDLMSSRGGLDLDAELDRLESDLQAIFAE